MEILGGAGITTSAVGNIITITNTAVASNLTFHTDSTDATSAANAITFHGVGGLFFSGAGSTVTGTLSAIPNASLANSSVTVTAGTGLSGGGTVALGGAITLNATNSGTVTSVSGTSNEITVTSPTTTPVISIASTYAGQTSITTLGTIGTGVWQGTLVSPVYGGTGVDNALSSTITLGGAFAMSGAFTFTGTLTANTGVTFPTSGTLATTSQLPSLPLSAASGGTGISNNAASTITISGNYATTLTVTNTTSVTLPTSGTLATTSQLPTLPLSLANGGTGVGLTASNGGIVYSNASTLAILSGTATANQLLLSGASTTPAWSTTTYPSTNAVNTLLYASSANVMAALATANSSYLTTSSGGVPTWAGLTVTQYNVLIGGASSAIGSVAPSTAGQLFTSAGASTNPTWTTSTYPGTNAANTLLYASSANVMAALATADNGVLITSASGVPSWLADGTTGQVLTATTGSPAAWANVATTGTFSPTITNAGSAPTGVTYTTQTGYYSTIGNRHFLDVLVVLSAYTAGTGNAQLASLPFTSNANIQCFGSVMFAQTTVGTSVLWYQLQTVVNTTVAAFAGFRSAAGTLNLAAAGWAATSQVQTSFVYQ